MDQETARALLRAAGNKYKAALAAMEGAKPEVLLAIKAGASVGITDVEMAELTGYHRNTVGIHKIALGYRKTSR